jgi:hypothetical protein
VGNVCCRISSEYLRKFKVFVVLLRFFGEVSVKLQIAGVRWAARDLSRNAEPRKGVAFVLQAQSRQDPSRLGTFPARRFDRLAFLLHANIAIFIKAESRQLWQTSRNSTTV